MKWLWIASGSLAEIVAIVAGIGTALPERHTVIRTSHFQQRPQQLWDVIAGPPTWRFVSRFVLGYTSTIDSFLKALHAKFGDRET